LPDLALAPSSALLQGVIKLGFDFKFALRPSQTCARARRVLEFDIHRQHTNTQSRDECVSNRCRPQVPAPTALTRQRIPGTHNWMTGERNLNAPV